MKLTRDDKEREKERGGDAKKARALEISRSRCEITLKIAAVVTTRENRADTNQIKSIALSCDARYEDSDKRAMTCSRALFAGLCAKFKFSTASISTTHGTTIDRLSPRFLRLFSVSAGSFETKLRTTCRARIGPSRAEAAKRSFMHEINDRVD